MIKLLNDSCLVLLNYLKCQVAFRFTLCCNRPYPFNPSNADATFIQSTMILTLSSWYSLDSPRRVLSNEYPMPCARVPVIFLVFWHHFVLAKLATSSIRVIYLRFRVAFRFTLCCNRPYPVNSLLLKVRQTYRQAPTGHSTDSLR